MTYVRTTDNIYEFDSAHMKISHDKVYKDISDEEGSMTGQPVWLCLGNCIRVSDNLMSLFDEFIWGKTIIRFIDPTHFSYVNDDFVFELNELVIKEGIYGAVWFDNLKEAPVLKGVAKMIKVEDFKLI